MIAMSRRRINYHHMIRRLGLRAIPASEVEVGDKIYYKSRFWIRKREVASVEPIKIFNEPHFIYVDLEFIDNNGKVFRTVKIDEKVLVKRRRC